MGNKNWTEPGDNSVNPKYPAFREDIVDFIKPVWSYSISSIDRVNNKVIIEIKGEDNYYNESLINENDIKVLVDDIEIPTITKEILKISEDNKAAIYKITLGNFKENIGKVKFEIAEETLKDTSGNSNIKTTINVGNKTWVEEGDNKDLPKYLAFREDIVDFKEPKIKYQYSIGTKQNPDLDYTKKILTVSFDVIDKYLLTSDIRKEDIQILVGGQDITTQLRTILKVGDIPEGKRYVFEITNFELEELIEEPYRNYSGPVQLIFAANRIDDTSGNKNLSTTITIDRADGTSTPSDGIIVDFIKPVWEYSTSSIDRAKKEVLLEIKAIDKYYKQSSLTENDIKVYVDGKIDNNVTKKVIKQKEDSISATYKIELGNFTGIGGIVGVEIAEGTIKDTSENVNIVTNISVGNKEWLEIGDDPINPKYNAFRKDIVDFEKPKINYQYSAVTTKNPDINYQEKNVTIKFNVIDRELIDNPLTENDIKILVDGIDITQKLNKVLHIEYVEDGNRYTLELSNFELEEILPGEKYKNYSGPIQLLFEANRLEDTSGNKNDATTITIDYDNGDDINKPIIVDVVDPIWNYETSSIDRTKNEVTIQIKGTDKYYKESSLTSDKINVLINDVENQEVTKVVNKVLEDKNSVIYEIVLGNFGTNTGVTKLRLQPGTLTDMSGNSNISTEILIGNKQWNEKGDSEGKYLAFRESIVDFIKPNIKYEISEKNRNLESVILKIKLDEKYYYNYELTNNDIMVFVEDKEVPEIVKNVTAKIVNKEVIYTISLTNLHEYPGKMYIKIKENSLLDTSGNSNNIIKIDVGNPNWNKIEEFDKAFDKNIVDFRRPEITYTAIPNENPIVDRINKNVVFEVEVKEQFIDYEDIEGSKISENEINVLIDNEIAQSITKKIELIGNYEYGQKYKVTLSDFEEAFIKKGKEYVDYSGVITLKIDENAIKDTSANTNLITNLIVKDENQKDIIVDFIDPKIYYVKKDIDIDNRRTVLEIKGTDKFYDNTYRLTLDDIEITLNGKSIKNSIYPIKIVTSEIVGGYDYKIQIDEFTKEGELQIYIPERRIYDQFGNYNKEVHLTTKFDNKKPEWKYISSDSSKLDSQGKIEFRLLAEDKYLIMEQSNLINSDIQIYIDGENITNTININVKEEKTIIQEDLRKKQYLISIVGLNRIGAITMVIRQGVLIDELENKSDTQTITFSKSVLSSQNYSEVTYFVNNDRVHVNELLNINEAGTNINSTTYMPSSLVEIWNENRNLTSIEMQENISFRGWAETNDLGEIIYYTDSSYQTASNVQTEFIKIYKLYEEIPSRVTKLRAVWQKANVIFVSSLGNDQNSGLSPNTAVKTLEGAFNKLSTSGDITNQIIVVTNQIHWTSQNNSSMLNKNATITSVYGGKDYKSQGAGLIIDANMELNANLIFDNIRIDSNAQNMLICNYNDLIIGRGVVSTNGKHTFETIIGGNYKTEKNTGNIGIHKMKIERGNYGNIIIGSIISNSTKKVKYVSHEIEIGNKKDGTRAQNDRLIIDGYLGIGENEKEYYPYNQKETQNKTNAFKLDYANVDLYSGTFTAQNTWNKNQEKASIYLRTFNGESEGKVKFRMYGGEVRGNIYGGSRIKDNNPTEIMNSLKFYGGKVSNPNTENGIFGQGTEKGYFGSSEIVLTGIFNIDGNVYGGGNASIVDDGYGTGNTNINISSASVKVNGNIFGGSNASTTDIVNTQSGYINGCTNITLTSGTIIGNVYGGGNNAGIGTYNATLNTQIQNAGTTNLNLSGGEVVGNIYGGSNKNHIGVATNINIENTIKINGDIYGGCVQTNGVNVGVGYTDGKWFNNATSLQNFKTTNINITGGIIGKSGANNKIYGSNKQENINYLNDNILENTNITLNGIDIEKLPQIYSTIYGSGTFDKVWSSNIYLKSENIGDLITIYGGSDQESQTENSNIYLQGGNVNEIYGGSNLKGKVITSNINLDDGNVRNVYGAGNQIEVTTSNVNENNANVIEIYGGSNTQGITPNTNIRLKMGNVTNVYGGGNKASVENSNICVEGSSIQNIYGGSNIQGTTINANINLNNGYIGKVFAGGNETSVQKATIVEQGSTVNEIYGGSNKSGIITDSNIIIKSGSVQTIYGGGQNSVVQNSQIVSEGGNVTEILGGANTLGVVENSLITLRHGDITDVYGGGFKVGVTNPNIILEGAIIKNIYGGNKTSGNIENTKVTLKSGKVQNVYGGNNAGGVTQNSNIDIQGNVIVEENIYGGGNKSSIGTMDKKGTININMTGGTIGKDINGGSKEEVVYGDININVGNYKNNTQITEKINIKRNIYGSGTSWKSENIDTGINYDYNYISVYGNININIKGKKYNNLNISGSIFGAGNASNYEGNANLNIYDYGTLEKVRTSVSIQRFNKVFIDNSFVELIGIEDKNNYFKKTSYTFNRIDSLTISNNTNIYLRRGVNLVKEFNSLKGYDKDGNKILSEVTIINGVETKNVDNRIYVVEGVNIIFANVEGDIYKNTDPNMWGDVNGMTFFGMYGFNRSTGKLSYDIYDPNYTRYQGKKGFFIKGAFIEGKHKLNHDLNKDGFYTNIGNYTNPNDITITKQYIDVLSHQTPYYDWSIGQEVKNYETTLVASVYATEISSSIKLDYNYEPGAEYSISRISLTSLNNNVNLVQPSEIPYITNENDANKNFALTVKTNKSGWINSAESIILTENGGIIEGENIYKSDNSKDSPEIDFKLYNSTNITERQDLGSIKIVLTGKTKAGEDSSQGNIFVVSITVNLKTAVEKDEYVIKPSFKERNDTDLKFTTDSQIDMSYLMYKNEENLINRFYQDGDYRVLSSNYPLIKGTKLTLIDYGENLQQDKVYYYQIKDNLAFDAKEIYEDGTQRYIYNLSNFTEMGSTTAKYMNDNSKYNHINEKYIFEKYDLTIDLENTQSYKDQIGQHIYLEIRNANNQIKADQGKFICQFDLLNNKNAQLIENIDNEYFEYETIKNQDISFKYNMNFKEQQLTPDIKVMDTKYYGKKIATSIEICDMNNVRIDAKKVGSFGVKTTEKEEYYQNEKGIIRFKLSDGFSEIQKNLNLVIKGLNLYSGKYKVRIATYTSEDGIYPNNQLNIDKEYYLYVINDTSGFKVDMNNLNRIYKISEGNNLEKQQEIKANIKIQDVVENTNLRISLYKRNPTYDNNNYAGINYTIVDYKQYFNNNYNRPEDEQLISSNTYEYIVANKTKFDISQRENIINYLDKLKNGISTGEYKLEFKLFVKDTFIQSIEKTFLIVE